MKEEIERQVLELFGIDVSSRWMKKALIRKNYKQVSKAVKRAEEIHRLKVLLSPTHPDTQQCEGRSQPQYSMESSYWGTPTNTAPRDRQDERDLRWLQIDRKGLVYHPCCFCKFD